MFSASSSGAMLHKPVARAQAQLLRASARHFTEHSSKSPKTFPPTQNKPPEPRILQTGRTVNSAARLDLTPVGVGTSRASLDVLTFETPKNSLLYDDGHAMAQQTALELARSIVVLKVPQSPLLPLPLPPLPHSCVEPDQLAPPASILSKLEHSHPGGNPGAN